ncbi:MAG TPA: hypothetical protein VGM54_24765 [Chthoniobacter sp.]
MGARFRYFKEHKNDFDTIFIGSSRIQNHLIPQQFDAHNSAHGVVTHSFNLGYAGMWPPESFYFLREVLALRPAKLRWAVIELMDYRFGELERNPFTSRAVYWHDWQHTCMAWRLIVESPLPLNEKCQELALHTSLYLRRLTNAGRGAEWLRFPFASGRPKEDTGWMKRGGFDPAAEMGSWTDAALADYARQVAAVRDSLPPRTARPGFSDALRSLLKDLQEAGVEPIFVISPTVRSDENLLLGLPDGLTVFAFNQPAEFPQLFEAVNHVEPRHLNEKGAREFTRLFAERFSNHVSRP